MSRFAFFKQSGWMLFAAVAGGVFTWLVHPILNKPISDVFAALMALLGKVPEVAEYIKTVEAACARIFKPPITQAEYGLFNALLSIVSLLNIPSSGLQPIMAQQTASAVTPEHERQLRGTLRTLLGVTFGIWVLIALSTLVMQSALMAKLKVYHPASLWATVLIGLPVLWLPILLGVLQGKQNFLWLGTQSILNALFRCLGVLVLVRLVGVHITGAMAGVLLGTGISLLICGWQAYPMLLGAVERIDWRAWLRRVLPLTLGLGSATFMLAADMIMARAVFPEADSGYFSAVGIIGRALVFFTVPLTQVMFPKIAHAAARSESTDVMLHALGATALLGAIGALFCTIFPGLPLQLLSDDKYLQVAPLVPWYAWCVVPATLSNVLINNLLARQHFKGVPWLVLVAIVYGLTLYAVSSSLLGMEKLAAFRTIVLIFGGYSVVFLAISIWFTIKKQ
jgi:O-antigen/teichoic acid export membrane protein